jgi:uncharacterized damage-inducible protein DinB
MTQRTEALAAAFEQAANRIVLAVEGLSDQAWDKAPAGEQRSASQIAYHMAEVYQNVGDWILQAAAGQQLPPLTMEDIHSMNAEQADRYASAGRARAVDLLRHNSAATAAVLRSLSDAQLDTHTVFVGFPLTVEGIAQNALVHHANEHLASIQAAAALA